MGNAIGQVLTFGIGVAISPIPIIGVILMLATARGRTNAIGFLAGWVVGLALVGTIVMLVSGGADAHKQGTPADWVSVLNLVLGVVLVAIAIRKWRSRPRDGAEPELPGWMTTIDTFGTGKAAGFGVLLSAVNPKNLLLAAGAATAIAGTGESTGSQAVAYLVFIVIATLGVGAPVAIYLALGERSKQILESLRVEMARHNAVIMAVLCLLIGAKLVGDGISGLSL